MGDIDTDAALGNHLKANASSVDCVKGIHQDFLKDVATKAKTVLDYLKDANTLKDIPSGIVKDFTPTCTLLSERIMPAE